MNGLQDQGRSLYKRGQYHEAIKYFDRAIGKGVSVQLLDNRAACYEKLKDLSLALQDAKRAIQHHREDPTGYLRAGQILIKMEKHSIALEIYSHGLKSVKHVGQGYELLKKAHKECLDLVSPTKSVDPLTVLPRELARMVLEYLSFRQRMNACLVSRGWCQYIRSIPDLWSHLDLSGARKKVRTAFVSTAINKGRSKLRKATLHNIYDFDKTLRSLVRTCPLEELSLLECGAIGGQDFVDAMKRATKLKSLAIKTTLNVGGLETALQALTGTIESIHLTTVRSLNPPRCQRLTHFSATIENFSDTIQLLENVPAFYPNIQSLTLIYPDKADPSNSRRFDLASCLHLRHLDLAVPLSPNNVLTLPSTLESLRLDPMLYGGSDEIIFKSILEGPRSLLLPHLRDLDLTLNDSECCLFIAAFLQGFEHEEILPRNTSRDWSRLRRLSLRSGSLDGIDIPQISHNVRLEGLEELLMPHIHDCDDNKLERMLSALPKLRVLDLTGTLVTGVGVKNAIWTTSVKDLSLINCRHVGPDAVEWARAKGVKVQYKITW